MWKLIDLSVLSVILQAPPNTRFPVGNFKPTVGNFPFSLKEKNGLLLWMVAKSARTTLKPRKTMAWLVLKSLRDPPTPVGCKGF